MDRPKSKVIRSKSSNSAIATKSGNPRNKPESQRNKTSKSNADFKALGKKRGVYVEKNLTKLSLNTPKEAIIDENQIQSAKPPPRPKPGSKPFLASVLAILSKSTTGTQHPDSVDAAIEPITKLKKKLLKEPEFPIENEKKKRPKYKSKVLNDNNHQIDNFEVLQYKREIIQTPSLYSERSYRDDIKLSDLPRLVKPENESNDETNNIVKEVTEGRKVNEKRVKVAEPTTLVSENTEFKEDTQLYNFFVDLLETTFSVYNVKTQYDAAPYAIASAISSRISFEMEESVAKKLNEATEMLNDQTHKSSKCFYSIQNEHDTWNEEKLIDYFQHNESSSRSHKLPLKSPTKQRRMKTESLAVAKTKKFVSPQIQSDVVTQRKSFNRKNNKKNLLNILKEQLRMDPDTPDYDSDSYEDPQTWYQALRVIAKIKRKSKTVSFDRLGKRAKESYPECALKRRNLISASTKSTKYGKEYLRTTRPIPKKLSEASGYRRVSNSEYTTESEPSNHSIEVYGFDYENPSRKRAFRVCLDKELGDKYVFTYHSSPSGSVIGSINDEMIFDTDSSSTIRDFSQYV